MRNSELKKQYDKEWARKNPMKRKKTALDYYYRNHEVLKSKNRNISAGKREFIKQQKIKAGGCSMCGLECTQDTWMMFDFDHIEQSAKYLQVSAMASYPEERILKEIRKCRLLCSNCHRFITSHEKHHSFRRKKSIEKVESNQQELEL